MGTWSRGRVSEGSEEDYINTRDSHFTEEDSLPSNNGII